eukprot:TRINITY_DN1317_c0_g2_i1.p1 TRINITY_DN1317_c0_g2~~TRINITY_DN1317_c0_g2_i1.p1  ORF type:complete len:337 (-),score=162.82 TRINITY_DN1317_c0_g2_i1:75-1085(-)
MGRKTDNNEKAVETPVPAEEEEDTPVVKELKKLDDEYLALEREYQKEVDKLKEQYADKLKPFLDDRTKLLTEAKEDAPKTGTPGLQGFWATALRNHPAFEEVIMNWDEPVLEYLKDITKEFLGPGIPEAKGFKLNFIFVDNPFFEETVLTKEYHVKEVCPYSDEWEVTEIKCTKITWKDGQDVTVEKKAKKVKGGGAKKSKKKGKEEECWRESLFRTWFRNLKVDDELPQDLVELMIEGDEDDDDDDDDYMKDYMDNDHEVGLAVRDEIIPFAVRWYTGEACPDDDDDDEDEEEEEEGPEDDSSDEEESPKGKKGNKKAAKAKADGGAKKEECKQQ